MAWKLLGAVLALVAAAALPASAADRGGEAVYLRNNVHYQWKMDGGKRLLHGCYSGWIDPPSAHGIVAVNTKVRMGKTTSRGFYFQVVETGEEAFFEFNTKNMGMTMRQYWDRITSPSPVSLDHLSELDRRGIAEGKALAGMTKEGVRIALGVPAPHRTPSPDENIWYYWKDRFNTLGVRFGPDGTVTSTFE